MNGRAIVKIVSVVCAGAVALSLAGGVPVFADNSVQALQSEYDQLEQRREQINEQLKSAQDTVDARRDKQDKIEEKISLTQRQVAILNTNIGSLNDDIEKKQQLIKDAQKKVEETYELYKQRVRASYMASDPTMLGVILGAQSISDFLMRMELVQRVSRHDRGVVNALKRSIKQLKNAQKALNEDKVKLNETKDKLAQKQSDLNQAFSDSQAQTVTAEREFEYYKKNKDAIEKQMAIADADIKEALAEARRMREERRRKAEEERKRREEEEKNKQENVSSDKSDSADKGESSSHPDTAPEPPAEKPVSGKFAWPVPGFLLRTSTYGWRTWPDGSKEFHKGIDIAGAGIYGARVVAAESGYILRAFDNGNGYGIHVLIDHGEYKGDDLATLYGHMSSAAVNVGDYVEKGQTIGYVGSTGWSTGPHLHFEVRLNGVHSDPSPYLGG